MKNLLKLALAIVCVSALTVTAAEGKKKELSEEGKKVKKEMTDKYDANKDGKLDQEEIAKISAEDKEKMKAAGVPTGGKGKKKDK